MRVRGEVISAATGTFLTPLGYIKCCPRATKDRERKEKMKEEHGKDYGSEGGRCHVIRLSSFGTKCHCHRFMACTVTSNDKYPGVFRIVRGSKVVVNETQDKH